MSLFLKLFNTTAEYNAYTADTENFILPNVSCTLDDLTNVHYNPIPPETRVVAKYNVTDTSSPTQLIGQYANNPFSAMEIDGVEQPSVVSAYTFSTTGEHTVKYTLTDTTSIGANAFYQCSGLTSIDIPNSVTNIGQMAFAYCSSLTSIGPSGSGASIEIPSGVTSIETSTFQSCTSLTSIDIPSGVTIIRSNAFWWCTGLTSVTIGSGVTIINNYAFQYCSSLTSIDIPSGVIIIGPSVFQNCSGLTSVTVNSTTPPSLGAYAFDNNASGRKIYVPSASVNDYKTDNVWSFYASDIEAIS